MPHFGKLLSEDHLLYVPDLESLSTTMEAITSRKRAKGNLSELAKCLDLYGRLLLLCSRPDEALDHLDESAEYWHSMIAEVPEAAFAFARNRAGIGAILLAADDPRECDPRRAAGALISSIKIAISRRVDFPELASLFDGEHGPAVTDGYLEACKAAGIEPEAELLELMQDQRAGIMGVLRAQ